MAVIETRNYVYENGWYKAIYLVHVPYGRGIAVSDQDIQALKNFEKIEGCDYRFTHKHITITHDELMAYASEADKRGKAGENVKEDGDSDDLREVIAKYFGLHWSLYGSLKSNPNATGVVFMMFISLKATSLEQLRKQLEVIESHYKKGKQKSFTQFVELIPMLGEEYKSIKNLLRTDIALGDKNSDTNLQWFYSGIDNFRAGVIQDDYGTPIGSDVYSSVSTEAGITKKSRVIFDFDKSLNKKGLIAIPKDMSIRYYRDKNGNTIPLTSIVGQAGANQIMLTHKVAHVVLNGYSYENMANSELYIENDRLFQTVNMNEVAINPLQPTGEESELDFLYTSLQEKLATMIEVASEFTIAETDKEIIREAVQNTLVTFWGENLTDKKILGVSSEVFPEIADFANHIDLSKYSYLKDQMSGRAEEVDNLYKIVKRIIQERRTLIGRRTNFEVPESRQTYYDFSPIENPQLRLVQLINSLNTIVSSLNRGDCLIVHGTDVIDPRIFKNYLNQELRERASKKGVKVIYLFDSFISGYGHKITEYKGVLYDNFDRDFGFQMLGYVPQSDFATFEGLYTQRFNDRVRADLTLDKVEGRVFLKRRSTLQVSMVDLGGFVV